MGILLPPFALCPPDSGDRGLLDELEVPLLARSSGGGGRGRVDTEGDRRGMRDRRLSERC
jgi:hypothetical protein